MNAEIKFSISRNVPKFVQKTIISGRCCINKGAKIWSAYKQADFFGDKKWEVRDPNGNEFNMYLSENGRVCILRAEE